jgi:hypothetical protein
MLHSRTQESPPSYTRFTRIGCATFATIADQNLASERKQNAKCANVMFMRVLW